MTALTRRDFVQLGGAAATATLLPRAAMAQGLQLPNPLTWTAYDVGSGGYNQSVAIGKALKDAYGIDLRVLPGKNDVSRQIPLRQKQVHFSATGVGASYMAQEGVFEFGAKEWGPQENRMLMAANSDSNLSVGTAADLGIKTMADLRGKRVAWVVGAPSLNENVTAMLAFAGLTWNDVKKVEFPGFGQSWDGLIANQVDAAFAQTTSGKCYQAASSSRGLYWPPLPHSDAEGWKRLKAKGPFFEPNVATEGANVSKEKPHEGAAYPYPILICYPDQEAGLVYSMTRAMVELFPKYKDTAPGINGWALERQNFTWAVPYHDGAVRYFKEIGKWQDEQQKHNDALLKRQMVLKDAWREMLAKAPADEKAFEAEWTKLRAAKLQAAGMEPVYS
jgi:TRAP transporter TAXI family solute receptor